VISVSSGKAELYCETILPSAQQILLQVSHRYTNHAVQNNRGIVDY